MEAPSPNYALPEAPGAKGARICGILGILFALTCVGIPVAIILGIVALVQHAKAKRLAREFPQDYRVPTASGMVLGIVSLVMPVLLLPVVGIVSAIAIPAALGQRERARDKACISNMHAQLSELVMEYDNAKGAGQDEVTVHASLEKRLQKDGGRNPWNMQGPACRVTIPVVMASDKAQALAEAENIATEKGEVVFVLAYSTNPATPGYIAGAVRLGNARGGTEVMSKAVELN